MTRSPDKLAIYREEETRAYATLRKLRPHLDAFIEIGAELKEHRASTAQRLGGKLPGGYDGSTDGPFTLAAAVERLLSGAGTALLLKLFDRVDARMRERVEHAQKLAAALPSDAPGDALAELS
jgi:hypothetical protein